MGKRKVTSTDGALKVFALNNQTYTKRLGRKLNLDFDENSVLEIKGDKGSTPDWIKDPIIGDGKEFTIGKKGNDVLGRLKPVINLDLFSLDENKNRVPIKSQGGRAIVKVRYNKIRKRHDNAKADKIQFFVLDEDVQKKEYKWINVKQVDSIKVKIVKVRTRHQFVEYVFSFIIDDWPVDDKWIATGP